jgi:hypothetical protein
VVGEALAVGVAEGGGTSENVAGRAQLLQEVANGKALASASTQICTSTLGVRERRQEACRRS